MNKRKITWLSPLLALSIFLQACSASDFIASETLIVTAVEIAIPLIPATAPFAGVVDTYLNSILNVADNLTTCSGTPASCAATATAAFGAVPIPGVPAQYQAAITGVSSAVATFISDYGTTAMAKLSESQRKKIPSHFSESDKGKQMDLHIRIVKAKLKMRESRQ